MNIGQLDHRVRIEKKFATQDPDFGTEVISWLPVATVWANVQDAIPSRAESVTQGVALIAKNQTRVRIRYRSDVDSSMRMVIYRPGPITYQIIAGPAEIGRKEYVEFMVERFSS